VNQASSETRNGRTKILITVSLQCHMILQRSVYCDDLVLKEHLLLLSMLKTVV